MPCFGVVTQFSFLLVSCGMTLRSTVLKVSSEFSVRRVVCLLMVDLSHSLLGVTGLTESVTFTTGETQTTSGSIATQPVIATWSPWMMWESTRPDCGCGLRKMVRRKESVWLRTTSSSPRSSTDESGGLRNRRLQVRFLSRTRKFHGGYSSAGQSAGSWSRAVTGSNPVTHPTGD